MNKDKTKPPERVELEDEAFHFPKEIIVKQLLKTSIPPNSLMEFQRLYSTNKIFRQEVEENKSFLIKHDIQNIDEYNELMDLYTLDFLASFSKVLKSRLDGYKSVDPKAT